MRKIAIHEGFINSKIDGDRHFLSFNNLCELYCLDPKKVVDWVNYGRGKPLEDYIHLYPRYDGDYYQVLERILNSPEQVQI